MKCIGSYQRIVRIYSSCEILVMRDIYWVENEVHVMKSYVMILCGYNFMLDIH